MSINSSVKGREYEQKLAREFRELGYKQWIDPERRDIFKLKL